jgi:hypothetical protein
MTINARKQPGEEKILSRLPGREQQLIRTGLSVKIVASHQNPTEEMNKVPARLGLLDQEKPSRHDFIDRRDRPHIILLRHAPRLLWRVESGEHCVCLFQLKRVWLAKTKCNWPSFMRELQR